jgi:hypothetical protein
MRSAMDDPDTDIRLAAFSRLRALTYPQSGGPDIFLNGFLGLAGNDGGGQLPATEVELLKL